MCLDLAVIESQREQDIFNDKIRAGKENGFLEPENKQINDKLLHFKETSMEHGSAAGFVPPANAHRTPHTTQTTLRQDGKYKIKFKLLLEVMVDSTIPGTGLRRGLS